MLHENSQFKWKVIFVPKAYLFIFVRGITTEKRFVWYLWYLFNIEQRDDSDLSKRLFEVLRIKLTTIEYKIDYISKTKNRTKKLMNTKIRFRTLHLFWDAQFFFESVKNTWKLWTILLITQKINIANLFFFISFRTLSNNLDQKWKQLFLRVGGGGGSAFP